MTGMALKLPNDFAKKISETLGVDAKHVDEFFDISEEKDGFFVAKLRPGKFLEKEQFKAMCALARDLGGEGYIQGAKAWKVPGPFAKKTSGQVVGSNPGRGIDSQPTYKEPRNAIPTAPSGVAPDSVATSKSNPPFFMLPVKDLLSMPFQSRKNIREGPEFEELVDSVRIIGVLQPIVVRQKGVTFEIVAGERRVAACKKLGITEVPANVKTLTDQEAYEIQLVENVQRRDLSDMEKARMLDMMIKQFGYTQEALAKKLGKGQPWVSHHLSLLSAEKYVPGHIVESGSLTERQVRELSAATPEKREEILDKAREEGKLPSANEMERIRKAVTCSRCGDETSDPFSAPDGKVYCDEVCYLQAKQEAEASDDMTAEPQSKSKEKEEPESAEFAPKIFTVWNFSKCDEGFGVPDFPGRIPAQIVQNVLYYYTNPGDFVVDPMAGSGTTEDVCKLMDRKSLCLDVSSIRKEIVEHDIRNGFPEMAKDCDLIFLDPPYFKKLMRHERYDKDYIIDRNLWLQFMSKLAKDCYDTVKQKGVVTLLISDYIEDENPLLTCEYYNIFVSTGFHLINRIQVPLSTQQYAKHDVARALEQHKLLNISRDLYVFRK